MATLALWRLVLEGERVMKRFWLILCLQLALISCAEQVEEPALPDNAQLVVDYVAAYNSQSLPDMAAVLHEDFQWLSVEGDRIVEMTGGKEGLLEELEAYFTSNGPPQSLLENVTVNGNFISARETAIWVDSNGQEKSQSAISIYEIEEGTLRRVWYFPAQ